VRGVERQVDQVSDAGGLRCWNALPVQKWIASKKPEDTKKLYALHEPEVECSAEEKIWRPYEFGVKVSITMTRKEALVGSALDAGQSVRWAHSGRGVGAGSISCDHRRTPFCLSLRLTVSASRRNYFAD
jgi:hypothetical protein